MVVAYHETRITLQDILKNVIDELVLPQECGLKLVCLRAGDRCGLYTENTMNIRIFIVYQNILRTGDKKHNLTLRIGVI